MPDVILPGWAAALISSIATLGLPWAWWLSRTLVRLEAHQGNMVKEQDRHDVILKEHANALDRLNISVAILKNAE